MTLATAERIAPRTRFPFVINSALWAAQTLAAMVVGRAGVMLVKEPSSEVAAQLGAWVPTLSTTSAHLLGIGVLLGALGLVGPSFIRIGPRLVAVAAAVFALAFTVATVVHLARGAFVPLCIDVTLVATMGFIAWGRLFSSPIEPHAQIRC